MLGTEWVVTEDLLQVSGGWLGLRSKVTRTPVEYVDWTIDGVPLRSMLPLPGGRLPEERTQMIRGSEGKPWVAASLSALLEGFDDNGDQWVRYDSGRTALLFCPLCGDLGCPAITARIGFSPWEVRWNAIGHETEFTESPDFETFDRIDLAFDRRQYEATIRGLLATWA